MKWVISGDGEEFLPYDCETREEAIEEGRGMWPDEVFFIGKAVPPQAPESYWDCEEWLDGVANQEDYEGDWADDWDQSTPEERQELTKEVRAVMAAWLDRHNLRPTFFVVRDIEGAGPAGAEIKLEDLT